MKTIGLLGGMSWESTLTYYRIINEVVKEKMGGLHSARCLLYSVDFQEIEECQGKGEWEKCGEILGDAALRLQMAGADFIVICTNTMHKVVPLMERRLSIPILHIALATAEELQLRHIRKVGLLGTKYTMTQDFYTSKLVEKGFEVIVPAEKERDVVNSVIYDELCKGIINGSSKSRFLGIIDSLAGQGAQGVILGCTEIGLLVHQCDTKVPLFDTTLIHARKAALYALEA